MINGLHHIAIIAGDYDASKRFYVDTLGLEVISETYRKERDSWKLDLKVPGGWQIELFSFPSPGAPELPRGARFAALGLLRG